MSVATMQFPMFFRNTWTATRSQPCAYGSIREDLIQATPRVLVPSEVVIPKSLWRLLALLEEAGEDDHGAIGPTQYAFLTTFTLVVEAWSILGRDVLPSPVVDSRGGIRVTWRRDDKQVKLVCPATKGSPIYIYHSTSADNSLQNEGVTAAVLAEELAWLTNSEPAASERDAA